MARRCANDSTHGLTSGCSRAWLHSPNRLNPLIGRREECVQNAIKALIGLVLIFAYHIPRLAYLLLLVSYAHVFNNPHNLTADPKEHLKRAARLLRGGRNSELLYAALELRFALERMVDDELLLSEKASSRMLKEYDPEKKLRNIHRIDPDAAHAHEIYLVNTSTGERVRWGDYKPLDPERLATIKGQLGDLLHPKRGLHLGIGHDPWYTRSRAFLQETSAYLGERYDGNTPFFTFAGLEHIEMVRVEEPT